MRQSLVPLKARNKIKGKITLELDTKMLKHHIISHNRQMPDIWVV